MIGGFGMLWMKCLLLFGMLCDVCTEQTCNSGFYYKVGTCRDSLSTCWTYSDCWATGTPCNDGYGQVYRTNYNWCLNDGRCTTCGCTCHYQCQGPNKPSGCYACPQGSTSPSSSTSISSCTCNAGFTGADGETCSACVAGKFKTNRGSAECTDCVAGTWSDSTGASECISCGEGGVSPAGSTAVTACQFDCAAGSTGPAGSCTLCVAGKYKTSSGSVACTDCGVGTYSTTVGASASSTCLTCPLNSNAPVSSTLITSCTCNAGFTGADGGVCTACVAGKYKTVSGSVACTDCGVGSYSVTVGATASSTCVSCPVNTNSAVSSSAIGGCVCNAGFTGPDGGVCSACVAGKYKTSSGSVACTNCGVGLYSVAVGATTSSTCISCPVNTNSAASSSAIGGCVCNAGFTGPDGGVCSACVAGKYKTSSGSVVCTDCAVGLYSVAVGATASAVCVSCPANSNSEASSSVIAACTCNAGFTGVNGGTCTACVAGKYKDVSGSIGCFSCSAGTYLPTVGATTSSTCISCPVNSNSAASSSAIGGCVCNAGFTGPNGGVCSACLPGSFKVQTGSGACEVCPNNTFSGDTGRSSSCVPCQANSVSAPGSASQAFCYCKSGYAHAVGMSTCRICDPGTYNSQLGRTACSNCSVGLYSVNYGAIGSETCVSCPAGQWSPEGSPNCNLCPVNSRAAAGSGLRTNCICDAGYTGPAGSTCVPCVAGTYKAATGSALCETCPALTSTSGAAVSLSDCWCVTGYIKVSGVCVAMVPRAVAVAGSLAGVAMNSSVSHIENATEAVRASIASRLNISIDLVRIERLSNSVEVRVSIFGRSETDLDTIESQLGFVWIEGLNKTQTTVVQGQMVAGVFVQCPSNYRVYNNTCKCVSGYMLQSNLTCTACAAGKYSAVTDSTACTDCPANTYSTGASIVCSGCPANAVSATGSVTVFACQCMAGYFFLLAPEGGTCQPCAAGSYKNEAGNVNCSVCSLSKVENQVCCPLESTMQLTPSAFSLLYERSRPKFHYSGSHWDSVNSRFLDVSGNGRHSLSGYTCDGWGNVGPTPIVAENTRGLVQADVTGVLPYAHVKVPAVTCPDGQCLVHMYSVWECVGQTLWAENGICKVQRQRYLDNSIYFDDLPDETCGAQADRISGDIIKTQQRTATLRGWNPGIGEYWPKWTMCYAARIMPVFNPESGQFDWYDIRFIQSSARGHFGIDNTVISSYVYGWRVFPVQHDNTQWTVFCIKSEPGADPSKQALLDGVGVSSSPSNIPYDHALSIGNPVSTNAWQLAQMLVWDVLLSDADMQAVSDKLMAHVREGELMPSGCGTASAVSCGDNRCICNRGYSGPENGRVVLVKRGSTRTRRPLSRVARALLGVSVT